MRLDKSIFGRIVPIGLALTIVSLSANAIELEITSNVDPVKEGTVAGFTLTVSNPTTGAINNVVLQATTPARFQLYADQQATPPGTCYNGTTSNELCNPGETMEWDLGTLAAGEVRVVRFADTVNTSAYDGEILVAEAAVLANGLLVAQNSHSVVSRQSIPPMQLTLSAERNLVASDELVTYRLQFSNITAGAAADLLTATVPDDASFVSATGGGTLVNNQVVWPLLRTEGTQGVRQFTVQLNSGLNDGRLLRSDAVASDSVSSAQAHAAEVLGVQANPSLELQITSNVDPVKEGTVAGFTLTVSNPTTGAINNVVLQATTPARFQLYADQQATPPGTCYNGTTSNELCNPGETMEWDLGTLAAGEVRVVRFADTVNTSAYDGEILVAEAAVLANGLLVAQNSHSVVSRQSIPPMQLTLSAERNLVASDELVTYRLQFSNITAGAAADLLTATVPDDASFVSATGGGTLVNNQVVWPLLRTEGTQGVRQFTVQLNSGLSDGRLLRSDAVASDSVSSAQAHAAEVLGVQANPSLELQITSNVDPVKEGTVAGFTLTVSNPTTGAINNVVLQATTPARFQLYADQQATPPGTCYNGTTSNELCNPGETMEWDLGTLAAGEVRVVRFADTVSSSAYDGEILVAEAAVLANGLLVAQNSHSVVSRQSIPPMQLTLSAERNLVASDELVTYRLQFSNITAGAAADLLTATVPDDASFVSATGGGTLVNNQVVWPLLRTEGTQGVRQFTVQLNSGLNDGRLLRSDAVASDSVSSAQAHAAEVLGVQANPSLELQITSNVDPVKEGTVAGFTLTVSNPTTGAINNVVLQATTPARFQLYADQQATPPGTCYNGTTSNELCNPGETMEWDLGTLAAGEVRVVRFADTVSSSAYDGEILVAEAVVLANGVLVAQNSHSIVVRENARSFQLVDWPIQNGLGTVSQDYAEYSSRGHHTGLDIAANLGTNVLAAASGIATIFRLADNDDKTNCLGNVVIIDHGEYSSLYAHMSGSGAITGLIDGQYITQGQVIGQVSNTTGNLMSDNMSDNACDPNGEVGVHLHFEVKDDPVRWNPSGLGGANTQWGYIKPGGGTPDPVNHPDNFGYSDPTLHLSHTVDEGAEAIYEVLSLGTGAALRMGPSPADYPISLGTTVTGQTFSVLGAFNVATPGCSAGWIHVANSNAGYFSGAAAKLSPDAWTCRGDGNEIWILPSDGDGIPADSDNCPSVSNADQLNFDNDSLGDACDDDDDNDSVPDLVDAFPFDVTEWLDSDNDGIGDNQDTDDDGDGLSDATELAIAQRFQPVLKFSSVGSDGLGVDLSNRDNCPKIDQQGIPTTVQDYLPINVFDILSHPTRTPDLVDTGIRTELTGTDLRYLGVYSDPNSFIDLSKLYGWSPGPSKNNVENAYCELNVQPTIYFTVTEDWSQPLPYAVQYWFFYFYNDWLNDHAGDWETITVFLDENQNPAEAIFSTHYEARRVSWDAAHITTSPPSSDRPVVFVSNGGHGSYPYAGETDYLELIGGLSTPIRDNHLGDRQTLIVSDLQPLPIDSRMKSWLYYPGRWGQESKGPPGPQYRVDAPTQWKHNLALNSPNNFDCTDRLGETIYGQGGSGPWSWAAGYLVNWMQGGAQDCLNGAAPQQPTDGASLISQPVLSWVDTGANTYWLKIRSENGAVLHDAEVTANCVVGTCNSEILLPFQTDTIYSWWVRPSDGSVHGPWSPQRSFTYSGNSISGDFPIGLGSLSDLSGDAYPDLFKFSDASSSTNLEIISGSDGTLIRTISFFNANWRPLASSVLADSNADGVSTDPAIAMLAQNISNGQIKVQLRNPTTGAQIGSNVQFLNNLWDGISMTVVNDTNGDGQSTDPSIAVVATKKDMSRSVVELRSISDSSLLGKWSAFNPTWMIKDIESTLSGAGDPQLAILGTDPISGNSKIELRRISDGAKSGIFAFGGSVDSISLSILTDRNGDGIPNDHAVGILARKSNGTNIVRFRRVDTGAKLKDLLMLGNAWTARDLAITPDTNSNMFEEAVGLATSGSGTTELLKTRDYDTGASLGNIYP